MSATVDEQMVWSMAQMTRPDDVVVVGVATPMAIAAALLARELLHPDLTLIAAATVDTETHDIALPMVESGLMDRLGVGTLSQTEILDQIQKGHITLQFVSPAQVDGNGRLNTSRVSRPDGTVMRLPGGLATGDIAVLVGRLVAYRASHTPRFLASEAAFTTGAGHDRLPPEERARRGLPGSGVVAVVTDKAVLRWSKDRSSVGLASVHSGSTVTEVVDGCGFDLKVDDPAATTEPPPAEALELLRTVIDPHGVRRLETRKGRAEALSALEALRR